MNLHPFKDLHYSLFNFTSNPTDCWTVEDAVRGTQIFGGIGSGKTSGSGKTIAKSFLLNQFGGLVLCAKKEERENWEDYAKQTERFNDVVVFSPTNEFRFNFLQYELTRPQGGGQTRNLVNLFMNVYEMGRSGGSKGDERFWDAALKRLLTNTIDLIKLSGEKLTVKNMYEVINTAPKDTYFYDNFNALKDEEYVSFVKGSYCLSCLDTASRADHNEDESETFALVYHFFARDFAGLAEKTRSTIVESFLGIAEPFLRGALKELFSTTTNIAPEQSLEGKIIILDISVQEYLELGVYAQCIFKLIWQQAVERRTVDKVNGTRPVFLWVDEAQYFLNRNDMMFQTTARSSRACTVFLSQNISNYYTVMKGDKAKAQTDSLLGNLSTKIFHTNNDAVTNDWASHTIGQDFSTKYSSDVLKEKEDDLFPNKKPSITIAQTSELIYQVLPKEFTILSNGGNSNNLQVDAIVSVAGKVWSNRKNYMKVIFDQTI